MFKNYKYYNAGQNEVHRYGHKAQEKAASHLEPNEQGFYSIPADGGKYWTIGTSNGKFGEFAKFHGTFLSVNSAGKIWAKVGTPKADAFIEMVNSMIEAMKKRNQERLDNMKGFGEEEEEA